MKEEINLLPKIIIVGRERRAYLTGFGRLVQRVSLLLMAIILGEVIVYGAYYYIDQTLEESWRAQAQNNNVLEEVQRVNMLLTLVDSTQRTMVSWSLFVEEALNSAPSDITINKIEVKEKLGALEVDGSSTNRAAVLQYKNILAGLSWVARVDAPLQNYAIGPDSGFSFKVIIKNSAE